MGGYSDLISRTVDKLGVTWIRADSRSHAMRAKGQGGRLPKRGEGFSRISSDHCWISWAIRAEEASHEFVSLADSIW